jgi:hypothetical protein
MLLLAGKAPARLKGAAAEAERKLDELHRAGNGIRRI